MLKSQYTPTKDIPFPPSISPLVQQIKDAVQNISSQSIPLCLQEIDSIFSTYVDQIQHTKYEYITGVQSSISIAISSIVRHILELKKTFLFNSIYKGKGNEFNDKIKLIEDEINSLQEYNKSLQSEIDRLLFPTQKDPIKHSKALTTETKSNINYNPDSSERKTKSHFINNSMFSHGTAVKRSTTPFQNRDIAPVLSMKNEKNSKNRSPSISNKFNKRKNSIEIESDYNKVKIELHDVKIESQKMKLQISQFMLSMKRLQSALLTNSGANIDNLREQFELEKQELCKISKNMPSKADKIEPIVLKFDDNDDYRFKYEACNTQLEELKKSINRKTEEMNMKLTLYEREKNIYKKELECVKNRCDDYRQQALQPKLTNQVPAYKKCYSFISYDRVDIKLPEFILNPIKHSQSKLSRVIVLLVPLSIKISVHSPKSIKAYKLISHTKHTTNSIAIKQINYINQTNKAKCMNNHKYKHSAYALTKTNLVQITLSTNSKNRKSIFNIIHLQHHNKSINIYVSPKIMSKITRAESINKTAKISKYMQSSHINIEAKTIDSKSPSSDSFKIEPLDLVQTEKEANSQLVFGFFIKINAIVDEWILKISQLLFKIGECDKKKEELIIKLKMHAIRLNTNLEHSSASSQITQVNINKEISKITQKYKKELTTKENQIQEYIMALNNEQLLSQNKQNFLNNKFHLIIAAFKSKWANYKSTISESFKLLQHENITTITKIIDNVKSKSKSSTLIESEVKQLSKDIFNEELDMEKFTQKVRVSFITPEKRQKNSLSESKAGDFHDVLESKVYLSRDTANK